MPFEQLHRQDNLFLVQIVTAFITSITFSIILKTNKRHLVYGGICGTLTYAAYFGVLTFTDSLFWAAFISSVVAALFSEVNARIAKAPTIVMLMAGVIPIVPGGYLYRAVRDFVRGVTSSAIDELVSAGAVALGVAGGVVSLTLVYGIVSDHFKKRKKTKINVNK